MDRKQHDASTSHPFTGGGRWRRWLSHSAVALCMLATGLALAVLAVILAYIGIRGIQYMTPAFFTNLPLQTPEGMRNCIIGTAVLVSLAGVIGVPLGMLCGIYLAEYARRGWFAHIVQLVIDLLAGTPTILLGVIAWQLVVVPMHHQSGWSGALALGFIMVPIVARAAEEMLRLVPQAYRETSAALGSSNAQSLFLVVLPAAKAGITTGVMLAVARVAGETAPLLFTALGNDQAVYDPSQPYPSLTLKIWQYSQSAELAWRHQAWVAVLVLVSFVLMFTAAVRFAVRGKRTGRT
ncbi:MAG: phosphate ABC transporter permease PstA [Phycisphaerae bacterium]